MTARIRIPTTGPVWLAEWNRNIERAIDQSSGVSSSSTFLDRIAAIEDMLVALDSTLEGVALTIEAMSETNDEMAAQGRAALHVLTELLAVARGRSGPADGEDVFGLINEFSGKEEPK